MPDLKGRNDDDAWECEVSGRKKAHNCIFMKLCSAILKGSNEVGAWDHEVGSPCVVPMAAGRYRLYYSGRSSSDASHSTRSSSKDGMGVSQDSGSSSSSNRPEGESDDVAGSSKHGSSVSGGDGSASSRAADTAVREVEPLGEASGKPWEGFGLALTPKEEADASQRFEGLRTDFERLGA